MAEPNSARGPGAVAGTGVGGRTGAEQTHTPGRDSRRNDGGLVGRIKSRAASTLESQKQRATEGLGSVAEAVRSSTEQLRSQDHGSAAGYVEEAADQIDRLSQRLKDKDVRELTDDAQRLARRHPAAFVGSAFALGIAAARFLKSSADDADRQASRSRAAGGRTSTPVGPGPTRSTPTERS